MQLMKLVQRALNVLRRLAATASCDGEEPKPHTYHVRCVAAVTDGSLRTAILCLCAYVRTCVFWRVRPCTGGGKGRSACALRVSLL